MSSGNPTRPRGTKECLVCEFSDASAEEAGTGILAMVMAIGNAKPLESLCSCHSRDVHTVAHEIAAALGGDAAS